MSKFIKKMQSLVDWFTWGLVTDMQTVVSYISIDADDGSLILPNPTEVATKWMIKDQAKSGMIEFSREDLSEKVECIMNVYADIEKHKNVRDIVKESIKRKDARDEVRKV